MQDEIGLCLVVEEEAKIPYSYNGDINMMAQRNLGALLNWLFPMAIITHCFTYKL